jgi:hypothetical protein
MGALNNRFFPYSKRKKAVISLVFAHKGGFKNIVFQTTLTVIGSTSSLLISSPGAIHEVSDQHDYRAVCVGFVRG